MEKEVVVNVISNSVFTVTIYYGENKTMTITKKAGEKLAQNELPEVTEGYTFVGAYVDSAFTQAFDFDSAIEADTSIYVKWDKADDGMDLFGLSCSNAISVNTSLVVLGFVCVAFLLRKRKTLN